MHDYSFKKNLIKATVLYRKLPPFEGILR